MQNDCQFETSGRNKYFILEPGYQLTASSCATCHSVDYIAMQPRGKGTEFWSAEVIKMVNVYGAAVEESARPAIVDYLARNY